MIAKKVWTVSANKCSLALMPSAD
uniref:Uncharacterized protein n=1 Tax=Arundo donax TaxID=35708 RepID=A0A0A9BBL6_ARUDO